MLPVSSNRGIHNDLSRRTAVRYEFSRISGLYIRKRTLPPVFWDLLGLGILSVEGVLQNRFVVCSLFMLKLYRTTDGYRELFPCYVSFQESLKTYV